MKISRDRPIKQINVPDVSGHRLLLLQIRHTIRPVFMGRLKLQALIDETALAACIVYVGLNPIRANMNNTPETSGHTSIKTRIDSAKKTHRPNEKCQ